MINRNTSRALWATCLVLAAAGLGHAQSLSVPITASPGSSLIVRWSGLTSPTAKDWIGLFVPGTPNTAFLDWVYTNGQSTGQVSLPIAASRLAGNYELRLLKNDGYLLAATGPLVIVTGGAPLPPPTAVFGPREPVGPDVPVTPAEATALTRRVTVAGFTAAAVQLAVTSAAGQGIPCVYLPARSYSFETWVRVPAGLTILGAGAGTVIRCPAANTQAFLVDGSNVRFTRLTLLGWSQSWTDANAGGTYNASRGVSTWGQSLVNVRVDHCDLSGFCYGVVFLFGGSGQVDHCFIRRCQVIGLGYGVALDAGSRVTVADCEMGDNRHSISANGAGGHLEALYNHFSNQSPSINQRAAIDTHAGFTGDFVIEGNQFDAHPSMPVGLTSGSGVIRNNRFSSNYSAITLYPSTNNGVTGLLHDVVISGNQFVWVAVPYSVLGGPWPNVTIDGKPYQQVLPGRRQPGKKPPAKKAKRQ